MMTWLWLLQLVLSMSAMAWVYVLMAVIVVGCLALLVVLQRRGLEYAEWLDPR